MSLFKQIAILVSIIFTLLFIVILTVSFTVIKQSAQKSLYENAQNSASSISLSITNAGVDESSIKTLINASFDNGNYERIVFRNMQKEIIYERDKDEVKQNIPSWFLKFASVKEIASKVNISSGWQIVGTLEVHNDTEVLYIQLYKIFKSLIFTLALASFILLIILASLVHIVLKPLFVIEKQALAIINNKFIIEKKIPFTLEFKSLTLSINTMVKKIQAIFENANAAVVQNKELLYFDPTTKLHNRHYFTLKASEYILEKRTLSKGIVIVLGISRVELLNKLIGYQKTNAFFQIIAGELNAAFAKLNGSIISRLNGTEFVAMIPCLHSNEYKEEIELFLSRIHQRFGELDIKENKIELTLGFCQYANEENLGKLFSKIDHTLSQAKLTGSQNYFDLEKDVVDIGKEQWREILKTTIATNTFEIIYSDIVNRQNETTLYKELNFYLKTKMKEYSYSEFIAPAIELHMLIDVYMSVIEKALSSKNNMTPIVIYLPFNFIECLELYNCFKIMLETVKKEDERKIIFEITEDTLIKKYDCSVQIIKLIRSFGYDFAVSSFIASSDDYAFLKELKPRYIKASKNFILDSLQNINLIKIIMESIGLDIVVVDVENEEEIEKLKKLNLFTVKMKL